MCVLVPRAFRGYMSCIAMRQTEPPRGCRWGLVVEERPTKWIFDDGRIAKKATHLKKWRWAPVEDLQPEPEPEPERKNSLAVSTVSAPDGGGSADGGGLFDELPEDLLLRILGGLPRQTLMAFAQSCKRHLSFLTGAHISIRKELVCFHSRCVIDPSVVHLPSDRSNSKMLIQRVCSAGHPSMRKCLVSALSSAATGPATSLN